MTLKIAGMREGAMLVMLRTALMDMIFPPRCLACPEPTDSSHGLCPACWSKTHFIVGDACAKCGVPLMGDTGAAEICDTCTRHPPAWDRGAAAVIYEGVGRDMILALKHGDRLEMVKPLAAWMAVAGRDLLTNCDIIAPAPLHWRRLLKRKYNQSGELAKRLGKLSGKPALVDLLTRVRMTTPQEGMNRAARAANQAGAFTITPRHRSFVQGKTVLLIDDVLTSGATLTACADCLRAAGARRIDVLALARVAFKDSLAL